jgi:hypothetical protein
LGGLVTEASEVNAKHCQPKLKFEAAAAACINNRIQVDKIEMKWKHSSNNKHEFERARRKSTD